MYDSFKKKKFRVSVGINSESGSEELLDFCRDFSQRTSARVRLVHAIEPWEDHPWAYAFPGVEPYGAMTRELEQQTRKDLREKLEACKASLRLDDVETNLAHGTAAEVLGADAVSNNASMIIVGSASRGYRFVPRGFSTALTLMARARVPVMAVPSGCKSFRSSGRLSVLYADDLTRHSVNALSVALEMASGFAEVDFHHLHVCRSTKDELAEIGGKVMTMMEMEQVPFDKSFSVASFPKDAEQRLCDRMSDRIGQAKVLLENANCSYNQEVLYGEVEEQLRVAVAKVKPDLVVFGRHAMVHHRPIGIGRLPFSSMLGLEVPVIVAPSNAR